MKLDMKISEKDKKLLVVLFSVIIIAASYYFGYNKIVDRTSAYESEIATLRSKKTDLTGKLINKKKYVEDTEALKKHFDDTLSKYANGSTQLSSIAFLNNLESLTGTWIKSVAFTNPTSIYTFGNKTSSNPLNAGAKAYSTDLVGYKTTLTLSYQSEYDEFKNLVELINKYNTKNTIDNITISYDAANGYVTGTLTVSMYSVTGKDRTYKEPEFDIETGKGNIFEAE